MGSMLADRWGVTDEETRRHYPCDDFVNAPALEAWRAVDIAAAADVVWPWVTQLRVAPYSYDWIDNLGRRSPHTSWTCPNPGWATTSPASGGVLEVESCPWTLVDN